MQKWRDVVKQQDVRDITYGCALASQVGIGIAAPVLIGMGVGYWLDLQLGTLPWMALILTAAGAIIGPIIAYRWVTTAMQVRFAGRKPAADEEDAADEALN
jgi:predicted F0F1-ATPase subunit